MVSAGWLQWEAHRAKPKTEHRLGTEKFLGVANIPSDSFDILRLLVLELGRCFSVVTDRFHDTPTCVTAADRSARRVSLPGK